MIHCPKCNELLVERSDALWCPRGEMWLSQRLSKRLLECFEYKSTEPKEKHYSFLIGGVWFCPSCGIRAVEEEKGLIRCPQCRLNMTEFIYELVEVSPHLKIDIESR